MSPSDAPPAAAVPAVLLAIALIAPAITFISNQLSRAVEARADQFSLELTREPDTFIDFQRKISSQNVGDPDPPAVPQYLLGTHPTTMERIGLALRFRQGPEAVAEPQAGS
jgi:STE24 endopeptidase